MSVRSLRGLAAAAAACLLLTAHSPYRQWDVYRKARLVVVASYEDAEAVRLGRRLAEGLARRIPPSRAMLSRARDANDLFRLLASRQLDVALVEGSAARAAAGGAETGGPLALRSLARLGPYLLVCRDDFPRANAYQVAEAVAEGWAEILGGDPPATAEGPRPAAEGAVPLHPGAGEYWAAHPPPQRGATGAAPTAASP